MEGFDTVAMSSYLASPLNAIQTVDYASSLHGIDITGQRAGFDPETFVSDEMAYSRQSLPLKRFPSYDDPFPDLIPPFEHPPFEPPVSEQLPTTDVSAAAAAAAAAAATSTPSIDHNHKLLSFSLPVFSFTLLDYSHRRTSLSLSAQLHGMFFLAESHWASSPTEATGPPPVPELTCYRRNLFQITGSVTLPRSLRYILTEQGDRIPVLAQELTVCATESVEGNPVKIISVPWKTPAPTAATATPGPLPNPMEEKAEKEPPSILLDMTSVGPDMDSNYATFPVAWKRLQFRIATANNGRRKELQQHFVVRLRVVATLSTGAKIPICEVHSGPVIVRGRSPRNFQSRKDLPLSGSAASSRKIQNQIQQQLLGQSQSQTKPNQSSASTQGPSPTPNPNRPASAGEPTPSSPPSDQSPMKTATPPELTQSLFPPFDLTSIHSVMVPPPDASPSFAEWTQMPPQVPVRSTVTPAPMNTPTVTPASIANGHTPAYPHSHASRLIEPTHRLNGSAVTPISLSLADDEFKPSVRLAEPSHEYSRTGGDTVANHPHQSSPATSAILPQKRTSPDGLAPPAKIPKFSPGSLAVQRRSSLSFSFLSNAAAAANFLQSRQSSASFHHSSLPYPGESADLLYEYFPLSTDDWQAPVDAVYRPHVVHHTDLPSESKFMATRMKGTRYFAAEDVC